MPHAHDSFFRLARGAVRPVVRLAGTVVRPGPAAPAVAGGVVWPTRERSAARRGGRSSSTAHRATRGPPVRVSGA